MANVIGSISERLHADYMEYAHLHIMFPLFFMMVEKFVDIYSHYIPDIVAFVWVEEDYSMGACCSKMYSH